MDAHFNFPNNQAGQSVDGYDDLYNFYSETDFQHDFLLDSINWEVPNVESDVGLQGRDVQPLNEKETLEIVRLIQIAEEKIGGTDGKGSGLSDCIIISGNEKEKISDTEVEQPMSASPSSMMPWLMGESFPLVGFFKTVICIPLVSQIKFESPQSLWVYKI